MLRLSHRLFHVHDPQDTRAARKNDVHDVPAVGAVVFDLEERVLLICRGHSPGAGEWTIPGGKVEPGEAPIRAAARELREETGLEAEVAYAIGVVRIEREGVSFAVHEFLVEAAGGAARAGDDAADVRWSPLGELEALGVSAQAVAVIKRGLELRRAMVV
jgi:8-oxo-dGTP diphosphatase